MALAYLMRRVQEEQLVRDFRLKAFIVNHRARKNSTAEAEVVASRLRRMGEPSILNHSDSYLLVRGIDTSILPVGSELGRTLVATQGFETRARVVRYALLAKAALDCNCFELLTGHHAEDQAENIALRLLSSTIPTLAGVLGMYAQSTLPETWDVHGAHNVRDELITVQSTTPRVGWLSLPLVEQPPPSRLSPPQRFNLSLFRPLLDFTKARLQETCRNSQTGYVVDPSNFSVQLTPRNAIRHMQTKHQLPRALSTQSLLHLAAVANKRYALAEARGRDLFQSAHQSEIDLSSGDVHLHMTDDLWRALESDIMAAGTFFAKIVGAVSPGRSDKDPRSVTPSVTRGILSLKNTVRDVRLGVQVRVFITASKTGSPILHFSRQPFRSSAKWSWTKVFEHDRNGWSKWVLWDNRFWLRIQCRLPEQVASFKVWPSMCMALHLLSAERHTEKGLTDIRRLRRTSRPLDTIPVITTIDKNADAAVVPTMLRTNSITDPLGSMAAAGLVDWQIHYKAISPDIENNFNVLPSKDTPLREPVPT